MQDFDEIVRQHGPMVYRLAAAILRHPADAEDVFQEVFLRCSHQHFSNGEHLKAWLIRVTINQCRSLRRSAWFRRRTTLQDDTAVVTAPWQPAPLTVALQCLPDKYRTIIHLYYYENYKTDEIATLLRLPAATVRTRMARARRLLADLLKEEYDDLP